MVYSFIHIDEKPCYARDRDGITVEVYEVRVGSGTFVPTLQTEYEILQEVL